MNTLLRSSLLAAAVALSGCATVPSPTATAPLPADRFYTGLQALCGQAFAGRVVADTPPPTGEDPFAGKPLVMHVRGCGDDALRVPFHVGEDRSRTWVITRTGPGLQLKHDHRHEDGSDDAVTMYGGDSASLGTAARQEFPVDEFSKAMFLREDLDASVTNTWAMELRPGRTFVYELSRPGGRLFKVEFDLTAPVAVPPAPWGDED
ncbi:hypothetical protein [Lysobacter sp. A3-1-A15]|uniref:hypothetical protein n=1 Tax=Novilysobacter viscosus TaxID=3098602 RepID=UPI002ED9411F